MIMTASKPNQFLNKVEGHRSSFRDPCGQVYNLNGEIYRQITEAGYADYQHLIASGLYKELQTKGYLIPHQEVALEFAFN